MKIYNLTVTEIFEKIKKEEDISEAERKIAFPCLYAKLVPVEKIIFNDYNPNSVAPPEMKLLQHSIEEDGYTQPIVSYYNEKIDKYIVIDGAHRMKNGLHKFKLPYLPLVALEKDEKERMASTIRHNRARGEHNVTQMSNIIAEMVLLGWDNEEIGIHLGMSQDEVLRLKQNTGIAEIFKDHEYNKSWE